MSVPSSKSISIVVPAFNEEKLLTGTVRAIQESASAFEIEGWEWELIVCDNNSSDRTPEIAAELGAQVIREPINQISRARNRGASIARMEWLLFIDADSKPTKELFHATLQSMSREETMGGGTPVEMDISNPMGNRLVKLWNWISGNLNWAAGSFLFVKRLVFNEIGGFSNELFASEEIDLCRRIKKFLRGTGKRFEVLPGPPLVSSGRKLHLYSAREMGVFLIKTVLLGGRPLKSKESCSVWYDGRR